MPTVPSSFGLRGWAPRVCPVTGNRHGVASSLVFVDKAAQSLCVCLPHLSWGDTHEWAPSCVANRGSTFQELPTVFQSSCAVLNSPRRVRGPIAPRSRQHVLLGAPEVLTATAGAKQPLPFSPEQGCEASFYVLSSYFYIFFDRIPIQIVCTLSKMHFLF